MPNELRIVTAYVGIGRSDRVQEKEMPSESERGMRSNLRTKGINTHYVSTSVQVHSMPT